MPDSAPLFREEQRFVGPGVGAALVLLMLVAVGLLAWLLLTDPNLVRGGDAATRALLPAVLPAILGVAVVWLFVSCRLTVEVRSDGVHARFAPLHRRERVIPPGRIASHRACNYRPIREYGGWGVRRGRGGWAYNVRGDRGVRLELTDGTHLLLGSARPEELDRAIAAMLGS